MFQMRSSWLWIVVALFSLQATGQSWKTYPYDLNGYPLLQFPSIEGAQYQFMGDSWFLSAQVKGQTTGKRYQIVTIFVRNYITAVVLNFYQVSIFDYETGEDVTYTDYDLPVVSLLNMKFRGAADHLDLGFNSGEGNATWTTARDSSGALRPFVYDLNLPGVDSQGGGKFGMKIRADMKKKPTAYGASTLKGVFTFYAQKNTHTYFQTGPAITGQLTMGGITENIVGTQGHIDRQLFPIYSGIYTPTGRQHSHEWRHINLDNGVDLAIWRQFDRTDNNTLIDTSGTTAYDPSSPDNPTWTDAIPNDISVEYISYAKYPRDKFSTLIPPPSKNMYMPSEHIITSKQLGMKLHAKYTTPVPCVTLPIEYFEGPAIWTGTYQNKAVTGVGIFESTLGLYRDWELAKVLLDSVSHLPNSDFSRTMSKAQVVAAVQGVSSLVSPKLLQDRRVAAKAYIDSKIIPALQTMVDGADKTYMLEIADDLESSLALILQF